MSIYLAKVTFKTGETVNYQFTTAKARAQFRERAYENRNVAQVESLLPPSKTYRHAEEAFEDMRLFHSGEDIAEQAGKEAYSGLIES